RRVRSVMDPIGKKLLDIATKELGYTEGRAAALSALALTGALYGLPAGSTLYESSVEVAAGLVFAVLLWTLPHAMTDERRTAG
ncbi:hypothetical protein, partial [Actinomadura luteofluorescens]